MFGQGGYGPPAMPPPPPFQQAPPPPPPPPLQQPPPPMPPPPFQHASSSLSQAPAPAFQHAPTLALPPPFQQNQSVPPPPPPIQPGQPHPVAPRTLLPQYQHGQTPLPLQHVPHPPPGAMNMGGPFLHIPPPNYANTHVMHSSTAQSHPVLPYPLPQNLHQGGPSGLPQSRGLPSIPPPPPLKGHAIYRNPPPPPAIQHVSTPDPPVPSGFVAANASFVHGPTDDAQPPYLPPPPPPPPPSSPPPLPPSPPPPALADEDPPETDSRLQFMGHQIENDASEKNQTDSALDKAQSADMMASEGSQGITDISGVVHPSMEGADIFTLSPPPSKPVESVVQNIETLCKFISKNGQQFESMVRAKESCNPQFAFLFGGEPGSAAAIGHEYFQWKKKIYSLEAELSNVDQSIPLKRPLQSKQSLQIVTDESASLSLADSDMDMEDDVGHPAREQEISKCPNQFQEPVSINNIFSEKEGHLLVSSITSGKNQSYVNSAAIKGTVEGDALESGRPPTAEATPATVQLPPVNEDDDVQQVLVKNGSPFRHIQGYASDSSSEDNIKDFISDVSPLRVSPKAVIPGSTSYEEPVAVTSAPDEEIFELNSDLDTQNALGSGYPMRVSTQLNSSSISLENFGSQKGSLPSHEEASPSVPVPCLLEGTAKVVDPSIYNQDDHSLRSIKESFEASQSFDVEEHGNGGTHDQAISFQPEDGAHKDTTIEVDEFGRRIRDVSDSDSDGIGHQWRHAKRERSSSRSLSPQEGRWRRKNRSPLRKKDKRSRSRSWSPRRLRSRSGSPVLRRTNGRRDHGQPPKCFNFLRGRCHRGSSCRYLHVDSGENRTKVRQQRGTHDSDKYDGRDHAIKEDHGVKNMHEEIMLAEYSKSSLEVSVGQELQLDEDLHVESVQDHPKYGTLDKKAKIISRDDDLKPVVLSPVAKPCKSEEVIQDHGSQNLIAEVEQEQVGSIQEVKSNVEQEESSRQKLEDHQLVPTERLQSQASSCNVEPPLDTQAAAQVSRSEGLFSSPSGLMQKDETSKNQCHGAEPHAPDQASLTQASSNLAHMNQPYANPQPFFQPVPGSEHLKSTFPGGGFHPHPYQLNMPQAHGQGPLYTPQFPSLPPPADYIRPFNQPFHSMNAPPRPSWTNTLQTAHMGDFSQRPPMGNQQIQEFGGPSAIREEDSSRNPVSASQFPSDLPKVYHFGPVHPTQPLPYSQQPASGLHYPVGSSFPSTSARLTDADISKVSLANHYNPFASTFEQTPRWSRYGSSFPSSHAPNNLGPRLTPSLSDGRAVVFSAQPGRALPIASSGEIPYHSYPMEPSSVVPSNFQKQLGSEVSVGDQYDPLLDSFETLKKPHLDKNPAVADADIIPNLSTSHRPIDQEDKSMQKSMPIASNFENEEFGETTMDAEIGAVENGSPLPDEGKDDYNADILDDLPNAAAGEIETERIPSPGKRKKSKDSRSMRLFKIAIANFVKEVLKPSWRQGNMSKEAFKTIVKKTVEKVSGAMPSHQVPKTQAKINHYVESSQRKLTKLVMGYVEKYVKV